MAIDVNSSHRNEQVAGAGPTGVVSNACDLDLTVAVEDGAGPPREVCESHHAIILSP